MGKDPDSAVHNAVVLEKVAQMAILSEMIDSHVGPVPREMMDKHYNRKFGPDAYYGQIKR